MERIKINDSCTHGFTYGKFRQKFRGNIISRNELLKIINWYYHRFPKYIQLEILNEMEKATLIKKINRDNYEIFRKDVKKYNDFYGMPLW